ncbi:heterokaryon incompatibility protein-domain-containing protein [Hyaloscypha finlandica]|nr:heterokaryon incompatibility protein-domain-containing protein [Hyaloscypha finlandica]
MSGFRGYVNVNTFRTRDIRDQTTQYYSELQWNLEKDNSSHDSPDLHPGLLPSFSVRMLPAVAPATTSASLAGASHTRDGLPLAKYWMERCCRTHRLCNSFRTSTKPTRLIDLNPDGPRICLSKDLPADINYATLSHCWGSSKHAVLKKASMPDFLRRIPFKGISKTIQDAFEITQYLGIRYLWVDSLCIVQDDKDDWNSESALMAIVYGNSSINIAASGAEDGTIGCFFDRGEAWRCQVSITIGEQSLLYDCVSNEMYRYNFADMPLGRRGWALQERLLPSRTLHFTTTQILWECHQKTTCEVFPDAFPSALSSARVFFRKQPLTRPMWPWIVERYSRCKLTYCKDKLFAISGLARNIQLQSKEQYVAGLWREDLELQLCWHKILDDEGPRYIPYTAPTWSWASIDGPIDFYNRPKSLEREHLSIRILKVKVGSAGLDSLGAVTSGCLDVSCDFLLHAEIIEEGHRNAMLLDNVLLNVLVYFDYLAIINTPLFVLPIIGVGGVDGIVGLLLQQTARKRGEYERIGMFVFRDLNGDLAEMEAFEEVIENPRCHAKSSDYARVRKDKHGRDHRIITLV